MPTPNLIKPVTNLTSWLSTGDLCRDVDRADPVVRRVGDVHNVAQRRDGDAKRLVEPIQKCSYGLCSYGLYSYGLYSYGLYSYGLYSYGREGDAERLVESI